MAPSRKIFLARPVNPAKLKNESLNFDKKPADPVSKYPRKAAFNDILAVLAQRRFSYSSRNSAKEGFRILSPLEFAVKLSQLTLNSKIFDARLYAKQLKSKKKKVIF